MLDEQRGIQPFIDAVRLGTPHARRTMFDLFKLRKGSYWCSERPRNLWPLSVSAVSMAGTAILEGVQHIVVHEGLESNLAHALERT